MLPGTHNITIYRGASYGETLDFIQPDGSPVDLTGLSPFLAEIRVGSRQPLVLALTVTDVDLENGKIRLSAEYTDTEALALETYRWGLLDNQKNLFVLGAVTIEPMIPNP